MVGLLLFQSAGMGLVFSLQVSAARHEIKQLIKAGVPEEDQVLLKIPMALEQTPNSTFVRKHEREFRYKGEMYDILRQEIHGDTIWYTCIHDVKESGLFKDLDKRVNAFLSSNPAQKEQMQFSLQFFHQQYVQGVFVELSPVFQFQNLRFEVITPAVLDGVWRDLLKPPNKIYT